ncbi:MAG: Gfo/Idh/MocA family oxidoreductase [Ignavibacteriae bacterium]|nr:Gfo/Idh/MocA family oxidoreductase [Ignavibacteriota bacterium]MCB9217494.1 Gfo/Idh/MocA family oxidoreductase [Ignavibacteria bacterium]
MSIQAGIIGCGEIAEEHLRALQEVEELSVVAYCDLDLARAERLLHSYGGNYATDNVEAMLRDDTVDALYICTHHDSHTPLALQACEAGKHIMMEKPLALTVPECLQIAEGVERSGVTMMTAFKFRYYPMVRRAREFMPSPLLLIAQLTDRRWPDDFWAQHPVKGGGNVLSQGVHAMDLLCYFAGSEPERIQAEGGAITHPGAEVVDAAVVTIRFRNGVIASLAQADAGETPHLGKFSYQMFDGSRSVHLHDRLKRGEFFDGEKLETIQDERELGMIEENREFVRALQSGRKPETTVWDGVRAAAMTFGVVESIRTGEAQTVRLD